MPFLFRQFSVEDKRSSMCIGTDAILLGAWTEPKTTQSILDVGTGCGVVALMLAQKSSARIDAIDIDNDSINECRENFLNCPWNYRLTAIHGRLQDHSDKKYDLICTNPPYFRNSLKSFVSNRSNARHVDALSFEELVQGVDNLLAPNGRFTLILPEKEKKNFIGIAIRHLLFLQRILEIIPKSGRPPNRILMEFGRIIPHQPDERKLIIRNEDNAYTPEYREITKDYYTDLR